MKPIIVASILLMLAGCAGQPKQVSVVDVLNEADAFCTKTFTEIKASGRSFSDEEKAMKACREGYVKGYYQELQNQQAIQPQYNALRYQMMYNTLNNAQQGFYRQPYAPNTYCSQFGSGVMCSNY